MASGWSTKTYEGREGHAKIKTLMEAFRTRPPRKWPGWPSPKCATTRRTRSALWAGRSRHAPCPSPSGDLLIFHADRPGCRFAARPSGTEPKIKFYLFARTDVDGPDHLPAAKLETLKLLDRMASDLDRYVEESLRS